ncbi:MAG TPA: hypothetical protein VGV38_04685 [Pyrinomonadaceae bacterium]|nr:hypothetical protein [Pyrinomonadaceae bacterium]
MSEPEPPPTDDTADDGAAPDAAAQRAASNLSEDHARLAYRLVQTLLEHSRVLSDLVALMAQVLDEDTTKALTETPHWHAYLDSRRALERARPDLERFTEVWSELGEDGSRQ